MLLVLLLLLLPPGIFNYGYFAFPVAISLFGEEILPKFIVFNLGVEIAIWTVGILFLASSGFKFSRLINPPAISIVLALMVKKWGGDAIVPSFAWEVIKMLGACSIPVGLLLIGGNISDLMKGFKFSKGYKVELSSVAVRLVVVPALCFCTPGKAQFQKDMDWIRKVLVVQAAMPAGIFALVVVRIYEGDRTTAKCEPLWQLCWEAYFPCRHGCTSDSVVALKLRRVGRCFLLCLRGVLCRHAFFVIGFGI